MDSESYEENLREYLSGWHSKEIIIWLFESSRNPSLEGVLRKPIVNPYTARCPQMSDIAADYNRIARQKYLDVKALKGLVLLAIEEIERYSQVD